MRGHLCQQRCPLDRIGAGDSVDTCRDRIIALWALSALSIPEVPGECHAEQQAMTRARNLSVQTQARVLLVLRERTARGSQTPSPFPSQLIRLD